MSTLADRLETLAANLQTQIDAKFADRSTNTPRKAQQAANARLDGLHLVRTQKAFRALAKRHRSGTVPDLLAKLTTKKAIEDLTRPETTRGSGYYDAPRETGKPANNSPAALLLWSMIEDNGSDERRVAADLQQKLDDVRFRRIPGYFATPTKTVDILINRVGLPEGETVQVLEPEAGSGNTADHQYSGSPASVQTGNLRTIFRIEPVNEVGNVQQCSHLA
ncbi:conserved hypothetical protein [Roseibium sp. TrichSKD4]|uniref:hypothetical protein n=1 Tax=Roseibium sp. TrichSKD4 TaxID=744980 RepID=UPI0001E57405|nr:hypothetical protein [Roseibium sp. TrichSKD4]EFO29248.1 conserved hypothetical protein [Roseibium sp. TrichSKD4]